MVGVFREKSSGAGGASRVKKVEDGSGLAAGWGEKRGVYREVPGWSPGRGSQEGRAVLGKRLRMTGGGGGGENEGEFPRGSRVGPREGGSRRGTGESGQGGRG